jgi:hypothetical protein
MRRRDVAVVAAAAVLASCTAPPTAPSALDTPSGIVLSVRKDGLHIGAVRLGDVQYVALQLSYDRAMYIDGFTPGEFFSECEDWVYEIFAGSQEVLFEAWRTPAQDNTKTIGTLHLTEGTLLSVRAFVDGTVARADILTRPGSFGRAAYACEAQSCRGQK